jgi:hypothetical protein
MCAIQEHDDDVSFVEQPDVASTCDSDAVAASEAEEGM